MKNAFSSVKNKIVSRYSLTDNNESQKKSTDINILLNRVKLDKKREGRKKILFSAAASAGVLIFGALIF
tara:strand:+ start:170 stop:376 length:207 start_codon:yes stop_codon:yes gene_type:complete